MFRPIEKIQILINKKHSLDIKKNMKILNGKPRIILCGPAAAGKTFISNSFQLKGYKEEISYTSRPIRNNEVNGIDYHFVTVEQFQKMINNNEMYEWTKHGEYFYGTSIKDFYQSDIFVWETEGVNQLKSEDRKNSLIIFVNTPMEIRVKRMKARGWELYDIFKRLQIDKQKFKNFTNYDFKIQS